MDDEVHEGWDVAHHSIPTPGSVAVVPRVRSAFSGITLSVEMNIDKSTETALIKVSMRPRPA